MAYSMNFFRDFEVKEIIVKPLYRVRKLPEYEGEKMERDVDSYYAQLTH
ncbi:MAG: hypothetical protein QXX48_03980 [Candidatus Korarchaeum sp.]